MKKRPVDIICSALCFVITPFFFISASALIPCLFNFFYYFWIDPLKIPQTSGFTKPQIIEAFNDVMNFIWRGAEFKTGELAYTKEEEMHFADCKPLFHLQLILFLVTGVLLLSYFILLKVKVLRKARFKGISPMAYSGALTISLLLGIGIFALVDFDKLFTIFHQIAFPGKENWLFDPETEQIILILPESFFMACAIFIIGMVISLSTVSIVLGIIFKDKKIMKEKEA